MWPGWRKPARYSTLLAIGLVTTALALPAATSATAWRIDASAASALVASGWPGRAVADACRSRRRAGRRRNAAQASFGADLGKLDREPERLGALGEGGRGRRADRTAEDRARGGAAMRRA